MSRLARLSDQQRRDIAFLRAERGWTIKALSDRYLRPERTISSIIQRTPVPDVADVSDWVQAEPVRPPSKHLHVSDYTVALVRYLREKGLGYGRIAKLAGVSYDTSRNLASGRTRQGVPALNDDEAPDWAREIEPREPGPVRGTEHHAARLNPETVEIARVLNAGGMSVERVAATLGLSIHVETLRRAVNRSTWAHAADAAKEQ